MTDLDLVTLAERIRVLLVASIADLERDRKCPPLDRVQALTLAGRTVLALAKLSARGAR